MREPSERDANARAMVAAERERVNPRSIPVIAAGENKTKSGGSKHKKVPGKSLIGCAPVAMVANHSLARRCHMPAADLDLVLQLAVTDADLAQLERTTARLRARCASCPWQMWGPSSPVLPSAGAKSGAGSAGDRRRYATY
jgi:hypothetical protein